jgi:cobalt/nickel transport system permease protein
MDALSVGAIAFAVAKVKKDELAEQKIPLMGVAGALVFAGQMINFAIPGVGASGHIGGGILLAGLLGGVPAFLALTAVLIIQCLFFADGGLLALGCNIFNMGVIPCLIIYPLIFKPLVGRGSGYARLWPAALAAAVMGLEAGAFCLVAQTWASGISALPFAAFITLMLPVHLAIGLVEGLVTAGILCFVYKARPEILLSAQGGGRIGKGVSIKKVLAILTLLTLTAAAFLSLSASSLPDGLEWSVERAAGAAAPQAEGLLHAKAAALQEGLALWPEYGSAAADEESGPPLLSAAGLAGALIAFALAGAAAFTVSQVKKAKRPAKTVS